MIGIFRKIGYIPIYLRLYMGVLRIITIRIFTRRDKNLTDKWLILERGNDAQDNAWHFFKYMIVNHPEVDARFAIRKNSPDFKRNLEGYDEKVLEYDSWEYYRFLFNSSVIISTHLKTWTPDVAITGRFQKTCFRYNGKIVFLQHGIIHREMSGLKYPRQDINLFISGAQNEFKLLTKTLRYPEGIIKYTGLARFDNLMNCPENRQILIMPTWRAGYPKMSDVEFQSTEFYKAYAEILGNGTLIDILRSNGYKLIFYNHYEFQKYNSCFGQLTNDVVSIVKFGSKSVQDLLKESSVVVTDYSSIYYDVLYMNKPIIFFQFDKEKFDTTQYGRNYDDVSEFGIRCTDSSAVIGSITDLVRKDCAIAPRFRRKSEEIFMYRDTNNCQRIYDEIQKIMDK